MSRGARELDRRSGELQCPLVVLSGEHAPQVGPCIHEDLRIVRPRRAACGRLESGPRKCDVAAFPVDLADLHHRPESAAGSNTLVNLASCLEVGDRELELAEMESRLAALQNREGEREWGTCNLS